MIDYRIKNIRDRLLREAKMVFGQATHVTCTPNPGASVDVELWVSRGTGVAFSGTRVDCLTLEHVPEYAITRGMINKVVDYLRANA